MLDVADNEASGLSTQPYYTAVGFPFTGGYSLVSGTTYWIVLERTGSNSNNIYFQVQTTYGDRFAGGYTSYLNSSDVWVANTYHDFIFKQYSIV